MNFLVQIQNSEQTYKHLCIHKYFRKITKDQDSEMMKLDPSGNFFSIFNLIKQTFKSKNAYLRFYIKLKQILYDLDIFRNGFEESS